MTRDINSELNQVGVRLARLEQSAMVPTSGSADIGYDQETRVTTVDDQLDWSLAANLWEPYSKVTDIIFDDDTGEVIDGGDLTTPYGRPEAHMIGSMCVLTGMVRRKVGAPTLNPGQRYDQPLFGLPVNWRLMTNMPLPCLMGNVNPDPALTPLAGTVSTAWIEVRPAFEPLQLSGVVYYVSGTGPLAPGTGWIALQGVFPSHMIDVSALGDDEDEG